MLTRYCNPCGRRKWEWVIVLSLTVIAFALRVYRVDFYSLSEDESAKWAAIEQYRHGHFSAVNSEHPMLPKMFAWGSLAAGERWNRFASEHHWGSLGPEGWLRLPNVIMGALTTALLYLLCRRLMGIPGAFAAAFFWAVGPLPIALNRLMKEETPLTFFTMLACCFYCYAHQATKDKTSRRWFDLSAIAFGLSLASQYVLHLFGLNALVWFMAARQGLTREPSRFRFGRFYLLMILAFVLVNPVIVSPGNVHAILNWLHHDGVRHSGYDFDGKLYLNFPSRLFAGLPWFYYLWLLLVKTPTPILIAIALGIVMLLRNRHTLASCYLVSLGLIQLIGLSVSGAKWIRYSLPLLPFLYLAGGYAVQQIWISLRRRGLPLAAVGIPAFIVASVLILEVQHWSPFYSFYLNQIGGGRREISRYFAPDETSEFDTREVAQRVCQVAPGKVTVATARPMSMSHYVEACGRRDVEVATLYDATYLPRNGDLVVLEPSRRFFETQRYFDVLRNSEMPHDDVSVGPIRASTIYVFDSSARGSERLEQEPTVVQLLNSHGRAKPALESASMRAAAGQSNFTLR